MVGLVALELVGTLLIVVVSAEAPFDESALLVASVDVKVVLAEDTILASDLASQLDGAASFSRALIVNSVHSVTTPTEVVLSVALVTNNGTAVRNVVGLAFASSAVSTRSPSSVLISANWPPVARPLVTALEATRP